MVRKKIQSVTTGGKKSKLEPPVRKNLLLRHRSKKFKFEPPGPQNLRVTKNLNFNHRGRKIQGRIEREKFELEPPVSIIQV